jgi:hypothetical protein
VAKFFHTNTNPTSTVDDLHIRKSSGKHIFDVVYGLDGLNRVLGADEGHKNGGVIEGGTRSRNETWQLSMTGNWLDRQLDENGNGTTTEELDKNEPAAYSVFTKSNEWTDRRTVKAGADYDQYAGTYDAVGNLTGESTDVVRGGSTSTKGRNLKYDVFGRLVETFPGAAGGDHEVSLQRPGLSHHDGDGRER